VTPLIGERFGPVRIFTAAELMAEELPPVRWVVPDILPEGVTFLAGKPKMGKSWLCLGLDVAVAIGGVALGTKHVEQGEVLYLSRGPQAAPAQTPRQAPSRPPLAGKSTHGYRVAPAG
jgi:hypothetical protein